METEPTTQEEWQARLDRDFPHGANVTGVGKDWTEQVPWFHVTGMDGVHPVVMFDTFPPGRGRAKTWTMLSYTPFQDKPLLVRVTFDHVDLKDKAMIWSAGLSPRMTRLMDRERANLADLT